MRENYAVYIWFDEGGVVRYVGWGPYKRGIGHPATVKWLDRGADNSELHLWLQSLENEPEREAVGPPITDKSTAYALACAWRQRLKESLFATRGSLTIKGGGGPRAVIFAAEDNSEAVVYPSVRAAARATGKPGATITRRCQNERNNEWFYADDVG